MKLLSLYFVLLVHMVALADANESDLSIDGVFSQSKVRDPAGILSVIRTKYDHVNTIFQFSNEGAEFGLYEAVAESGVVCFVLISPQYDIKMSLVVDGHDKSKDIKPFKVKMYGQTVSSEGVKDNKNIVENQNLGVVFFLRDGEKAAFSAAVKSNNGGRSCVIQRAKGGSWAASVSGVQ